MSICSIQGQLLEVSVTSCMNLKDTEWISRQDPYVSLEYGSTRYRTRTHTDGGKNPVFQEKFAFSLIEGLRELKVSVWNSNTMKQDDFIGCGMVQLQKVISQGFDDTAWPLHTQTGRYAGEVKLMMHYSPANKPATSYGQSAPPYGYGASHSPHHGFPSSASYAHSPASYQSPSPYPGYPPAPGSYPYPPTHPAAYTGPYAPPASPYPYTEPSYYSTGPYRGGYPPSY